MAYTDEFGNIYDDDSLSGATTTSGDYDFWESIGVNPDTPMENWNSQ